LPAKKKVTILTPSEKRQHHIESEKKRRYQLKDALDTLDAVTPQLVASQPGKELR
jgi:hypothetical protein